jgi:hypothetical protein
MSLAGALVEGLTLSRAEASPDVERPVALRASRAELARG